MNNFENDNRTIIVKILDETNVVLIGLPPLHIKHLYDRFGIYTKDYFFTKLYKLKKWDGKIRFFSKTGKTYVYLLPQIIPILKTWKYKLKLVDNRERVDLTFPTVDENYFSDYKWPDTGLPVVLGEHQVNAINAILNNKGGIIRAGTGAGKTLITSVLCDVLEKSYNFNTITIVPSGDLITQTIDELTLFGLDMGEYSGDRKDLNHKHIVSTWQAVQNNPKLLTAFRVILVDECHGSQAPVLKELLTEHATSAYIRIGLTGTLPKEEINQLNIKISLGDEVYHIPSSDLIESGWLASLKIYGIKLIEDMHDKWEDFNNSAKEEDKLSYKKFKSTYFPDYTAEKKFLKSKVARMKYIAGLIQDQRSKEKGNCLVLVNGVEFGKNLCKLIPNAYFVHGPDKREIRKQIYDLFKEHDDIVVVATSQVASTGLNIKRIFNLFLVDANKSFIQIIQSVGRGLRKAHDKDSVNVFDVHSDLKYSKRHYNNRIKYYIEHKYPYVEVKVEYEKVSFDELYD